MIPEDFIQELLDRVDIVDVVGQYVQLKKGGVNLLGLCPFHSEKTPSFTVSPSKQFYHCFGCGAHGSAITFLMNYSGQTFPEAVQSLATRVGLQVPQKQLTPQQSAQAKIRKTRFEQLTDILERCAEFYYGQLKGSKSAQQYFIGRGIDGKTAKTFGLGWSGEARQNLAAVFPDYQDNLLVESGMVIASDDGRHYDRFRERVMFPIHNIRGKIIGFGGRITGQGQPKYLNSPETDVFHKGKELYGIWQNRRGIHKAGCVIVVEGYMDVVSLHSQGIDYAVATLGTATSEDHIRLLIRLSRKIVFSFDGDQAGLNAAHKALKTCLPHIKDDLLFRFLFLPEQQDPDSFVQQKGVKAFEEQLAQAQPLSAILLGKFQSDFDCSEPEGRAAAIHAFYDYWVLMPDIALKTQIVRDFAQLVRATVSELLEDFGRRSQAVRTPGTSAAAPQHRSSSNTASNARNAATASAQPSPSRQQRQPQRRTQQRRSTPLARRLLSLLIHYPDVIDAIRPSHLDILSRDPDQELVLRFVALVQTQESRNFSVWLEQIPQTDELHQILLAVHRDTVGQDHELPHPQKEWHDAISKIELKNLTNEQNTLIKSSPMTPEQSNRYAILSHRIQQLKGISRG